MLISGREVTARLSFPVGGTSSSTCFIGPKIPHHKRRLDWFSSFCRAYGRDQQTDGLRYSVCSNGPHLATAAMRPSNILGPLLTARSGRATVNTRCSGMSASHIAVFLARRAYCVIFSLVYRSLVISHTTRAVCVCVCVCACVHLTLRSLCAGDRRCCVDEAI